MKKEIICTVCPIGCRIIVEGENKTISAIIGNTCKRGEQYAASEFLHPVRILTTTIKTNSVSHPLISVRSEKPIPKECMMDCMKEIRKCQVSVPINMYDVIIEDICVTGISIVATGEITSIE